MVGTGSVGLRDYVSFMFGGAVYDPLFIQIKEGPNPPMRLICPQPGSCASGAANGRRWTRRENAVDNSWDNSIVIRYYVVRQLRDHKAGIVEEGLKGKGLVEYADMCGELLSKGHARSGDSCAIAGYLGNNDKFDQAMAIFGVTYANQTVKDWEQLRHAIRTRKIKAAKPAPMVRPKKRK